MNGFRGEACGGDCMADNGCHGYEECAGCGQRFCRFNLDDRDLCPRCAERREEECEWCGRRFYAGEDICPQCGEPRHKGGGEK